MQRKQPRLELQFCVSTYLIKKVAVAYAHCVRRYPGVWRENGLPEAQRHQLPLPAERLVLYVDWLEHRVVRVAGVRDPSRRNPLARRCSGTLRVAPAAIQARSC